MTAATSLGAGCVISAALASLEALRHSLVWMYPQSPGFLAAAMIWGVHAGGNSFEAVMIVVNALLYGLAIFFLFNFSRWLDRSK
jgi:hypothetical protein